jgi:nucleoside-diphosphate-sugar epimerase
MSVYRFIKWISESTPLRLNGDGEQSRGFTFVDDIARGTILGLRPLGYEVINLGGHENITINGLIARIEELVGAQAQVTHFPFHPADMRSNLADVSKARRILGWEPRIALHDGLASCVEWYQGERGWAKEIETG